MRLIFLIIIGIIFISNGCKEDIPVESTVVEEPKMLLYLPLNGNANDQSGNENNATIVNGTFTSDRAGNSNSAFLFDGVNDYISIPNSNSLSSTNKSISVCAWIYINEWYRDKWAPIIAKSNNSGYGMYGFQLINFSTRKQFEVQLKGNFLNADHIFNKNQWYFVVFTWDGERCKYYVNGFKIYEKSWNGTINSDSQPLLIGKDTPEITEFLDGKLDEIRIYDKAINESQVDSLFVLN